MKPNQLAHVREALEIVDALENKLEDALWTEREWRTLERHVDDLRTILNYHLKRIEQDMRTLA